MAFKISSNTVINNSRQLENITNLKTINGESILGTGDIITGGDVDTSSTQTLTNKTISGGVYSNVIDQTGSVRSSVVFVPALDINCSLGNYFIKTISTNSTFTFSNVPASRAYSFTLEIAHTSGSVTWPASVSWSYDLPPILTGGRSSLFMFVTDDGGARWRGAALSDYAT